MNKPMFLKRVDDGRILAYTEALASRKDMIPVWPDGEEPKDYKPPKPQGLRVDDVPANIWEEAVREKDKIILDMQRQMDEMVKEISRLTAEISEKNEAVVEPEKPEIDSGRVSVIVSAINEMIKEADPLDFTGLGKARLEKIEARCGLTGVTGAERDEAMRIIKESGE
jgi:hypothetical protein